MRLIPQGPLYDWLVKIDKKLASIFGFSGGYTLSAECSKSRSVACRCLCAGMNLIEEDHCTKAAKSEGM